MSKPSQTQKEDLKERKDVPDVLVAEARETFAVSESSETDASSRIEGRDAEQDTSASNDFAFQCHSYVTEYIKLADQKAAFVFAVTAGMLSYLFNSDIHKMWLKPPSMWSALDFLCFFGMCTLGIGLVFSCAVIVPWLRKSHRGLVFFKSVADFESATSYASDVLAPPSSKLTREILEHTFDLSKTCSKKYAKLSVALWGTTIGIIVTVLVLFLKN